MTLVSLTLAADGSTADVADVNTPFTTIANVINGGLDNNNIAADAGIDGSKIADNGITAAKLATSAITLGYTQITANVTTTSGTTVQATGLTVTVTIPAGGRKVKITVHGPTIYTTSGSNTVYCSLWDGVVGVGTKLQETSVYCTANSQRFPLLAQAVVTPVAGSKTYNVGFNSTAGTTTIEAATTSPAFILVETI